LALFLFFFLKKRKEAKENARPLGKLQKRIKKILPINSIPVVIHYSSAKATSRLPKSAVHRYRAPFLCSFLLEKQKKGGRIARLALRRNLFKANRKHKHK
jgi:hypothetical protein